MFLHSNKGCNFYPYVRFCHRLSAILTEPLVSFESRSVNLKSALPQNRTHCGTFCLYLALCAMPSVENVGAGLQQKGSGQAVNRKPCLNSGIFQNVVPDFMDQKLPSTWGIFFCCFGKYRLPVKLLCNIHMAWLALITICDPPTQDQAGVARLAFVEAANNRTVFQPRQILHL